MSCETCLFWHCQANAPTYASVGGRILQVGQCRCTSEKAPYAEVEGLFEAAVFTHAESHCRAFTAHHNNQLTREAWA